jgi:tetratricopeptide (TPR) repeat protein
MGQLGQLLLAHGHGIRLQTVSARPPESTSERRRLAAEALTAAQRLTDTKAPSSTLVSKRKPRPPSPAGSAPWLLAAAWLVAALVYLPTCGYQFVFDDWELIVHNGALRDPGYPWKVFGQDFWHFRLADPDNPEADSQYYRPLFGLVLWLEFQWFGTDPTGYHAVNLLLYGAGLMLVQRLARRLFGDPVAGGAAALLFAAHPMHVENVAWVSGAVDLLLAPLFLAALDVQLDPAGRRHWLGPLWLGLALATKETALVLPAAVLILELLAPESRPWPRRLARAALRVLPHLAVTAAYLAMRWRVLGAIAGAHQSAPAGLAELILTLPSTLLRYLIMGLVGLPLGPGHRVRYLDAIGDPRFWAPAAVLLLLALVLAPWAARPPRTRFLGWAMLLLPLLPPLNLRGLYRELLVQDRYLYLPSFGAVVLLIAVLFAHGRRREHAIGGALAIGAFWAALALAQRGVWRDELTFFQRAVAQIPDSSLYHHRLGLALLRERRLDQALEHLELVVRMPGAGWVDYANLAMAQAGSGAVAAAAASYARALELAQQDPKARHDPRRAQLALSMGQSLEADGRPAEALGAYGEALRIDPDLDPAFDAIGRLAVRSGQLERAERLIRAALERAEWSTAGSTNLALLWMLTDRWSEAGDLLDRVVQRAPKHAPALFYWAQVQARTGRREQARAAARRALELQPSLEAARAFLAQLDAASPAGVP